MIFISFSFRYLILWRFAKTNLHASVYAAPLRRLSVLFYFCRPGEPRHRVPDANHGKRCPIEFVRNCRASARDPFRCRNGGRERQNFLCTPDWQFPRDTGAIIK